MAENYTVNYNINVASEKAVAALKTFTEATAGLTKANQSLDTFRGNLAKTVKQFNTLFKNTPKLQFNVKQANTQLNHIINKLETIATLCEKINTLNITTKSGGGSKSSKASKSSKSTGTTVTTTSGSSSKKSKTSSTKAPKVKAEKWNEGYVRVMPPEWAASVAPSAKGRASRVGNTNYTARTAQGLNPYRGASIRNILGATNLQYNGGMAVDMLKGMGIMYGLTGIGQAVSSIVNQATDYDNIMKTVENITKSHDTLDNFSGRFGSMSKNVRNVGMETKYTVVDVANAAKFLAMAGMDVDAINRSIRPIADIALVGDTDLGETADLVTNIMTAYEKKPEQMHNVADVMTNTFTMANTTLLEMAEAFQYSASLLNAGDVSFEDASAALGVLGDAGIKGSQAGTTMRTIMMNILNPTKKQQKAWERVGVKTTDENGNRRTLLQIFRDLSDKNLDAGDYLQLFHKTAASGAVALANHIDKWENVAYENSIAGGLSAELADEKKNTLLGLWEQVKSVFIDTGVTAFQDVQGGLRTLMGDAINWLKSDEAKAAFKDFASNMMEFLHMLKDCTAIFWNMFKAAGPAIKVWMKFQLLIWPVVKAMSALSSIFSLIQGIGAVSRGASGLVVNLLNSLKSYRAGEPVGGVSILSGGAGGMRAAGSNKNAIEASKERLSQLNKEYSARLTAAGLGHISPSSVLPVAQEQRHLDDLRQEYKRSLRKRAMNTISTLGGMAVGGGMMGLGMAQATQEDANGWDLFSGSLLGLGGMAAMVGGPIGWGAAAALGAGSLLSTLISVISNQHSVMEAVQAFTQKNYLIDGVWSDGNSKIEKMLEFVWRKNYDINQLVERRVELYRILYGIDVPETTSTSDVGNKVYGETLGMLTKGDYWFDHNATGAASMELFNSIAGQYGYSMSRAGALLTTPNGTEFSYRDAGMNGHQAMAIDTAATLELLKGDYRTKIIDENQKKLNQLLFGSATAEDVKSWKSDFAGQHNPAYMKGLITPDQWDTTLDDAKDWTGADISKSYVGQQILWASLQQAREAQDAVIEFKEKLAKGRGNYTESDVVNVLQKGSYGGVGTYLEKYNVNNIAGWFESFGYKDGKWTSVNGNSPEVMAQGAVKAMEDLLQSIKNLGLDSDPATESLRNYANLLLNLGQSFGAASQDLSGSKHGEIRKFGGQTWRWNEYTKMWELVTDDNQMDETAAGINSFANAISNLQGIVNNTPSLWDSQDGFAWWNSGSFYYNGNSQNSAGSGAGSQGGSLSASPFSWASNLVSNVGRNNSQVKHGDGSMLKPTKVTATPAQAGQMLATDKNGGKDKPGNKGGRGGASASDYKNQYKSQNAAPKQVIVRIGNLMNVDAVNLSDPNKAAVIKNLKTELAQALVDVVHDFDETWNG